MQKPSQPQPWQPPTMRSHTRQKLEPLNRTLKLSWQRTPTYQLLIYTIFYIHNVYTDKLPYLLVVNQNIEDEFGHPTSSQMIVRKFCIAIIIYCLLSSLQHFRFVQFSSLVGCGRVAHVNPRDEHPRTVDLLYVSPKIVYRKNFISFFKLSLTQNSRKL